MGLRDIERKIRMKSAYQEKEAEMMLTELDLLIQNYRNLEKQLKEFEKKHGKKIKDNREYYEKLSEFRRELGLPEEIGVYDWKEKPTFVDKLTGKGYYDEIANEILQIGKDSLRETGGLMSAAEVTLRLNKARPGKIVSPKDVIKALESLKKSGLIQDLKKLDSGTLIVEFVAVGLSKDQEKVLSLAARRGGAVTLEEVLMKTKWPMERATRALDAMVEDGIALQDEDYSEGKKYWFPALG